MYKIVEARTVGLNIKQFVIEAPRIARKQQPGQFLILRLHEKGERIPLTIKSSDPAAGTVTRSEEHTSELQSLRHLVCRLLLEKKINRHGRGRSPRPRSHEPTSDLQTLRQ